jgi:alpha/beta superfamily hydrolase
LKGKIMNISPNVKPALWGAAGGAVALAILGFTWGGWVTSSTATAMADKQATIEVAKVLAPVCLSQFNQQRDAAAKLAELKGIKSLYEQASYIEKSGAATMPGSDKMAKGVSQACAELLTKVAS